ncbi:MAG: hypothetical protein ACR2QS_15445 [Woeseiaceae bacterium]
MNKLIEELSKRNVFRVAAAYCVVGWLIAQVADLAADNFAAPDWVMRMLLIVLLLGLPVAIFLAWAFELTPAGVVRAEDVPEGAPKDPRSGRLLNRIIIGTLVVIVLGLVWDRSRVSEPRPAETEVATTVEKSIAVLPFADFSPDGDQRWFADGLTDEILNALARADDLRVASRTSAFSYRDSPLEIPEIAAELGVAHILEGSVRRSQNRIRVTAQLIRATDDSHLWSDTFDGDSEDAIDIQENIALAIARALQTTMDPEELESMLAAGTRSIEAWELYLRAQEMLRNLMDSSDLSYGDMAISMLKEAVAVDPSFADAHISMAQLYNWHLRPTSMLRLSSVTSDTEARALFNDAISAAAANARSDATKLEYQGLQASAEMRFDDFLRLSNEWVALAPNDIDAYTQLLIAQTIAGEYEASAATAQIAADHLRSEGRSLWPVYQFLHRVDVDAALIMVKEDLTLPSHKESNGYQAHRVLLYAGDVEGAARLARDLLRESNDDNSTLMVEVRQACAEGRVADADAAYESAADTTMRKLNNWIYLKTLGFDQEAKQFLLPFDNPDGMYSLGAFMVYTAFDPNDFPYFASRLAEQGISRPPAHKIPFACKR